MAGLRGHAERALCRITNADIDHGEIEQTQTSATPRGALRASAQQTVAGEVVFAR
jgi:hypothetical protein